MNKINTINGVLMASQDELNEHVENGTAHVTEEERTVWNTQASVNAKGIVIATQGDLDEHAGNKAIHLTEEERTAWNAKADASALSGKVNTAMFNAHKSDAVAHVTAEDRQHWDSKQDKIIDESGNMTLPGNVTAASVNNAGGAYVTPMGTHVYIGSYVKNPTSADNGKTWLMFSNHEYGSYLQIWGVSSGKIQPCTLNMTRTHFIDGFSCSDGTFSGTINANGGINAVAMLAPELPKTGLNAGAAAVMSVLGNVYHLDHVNGSTMTVLDGSNVKQEHVLTGWCGLSWAGTLTAHKCILIKSAVTNTNYGGAFSPMGTSDYALVMSYLSGVNMVDSSTKFGFTGYSGTVAATTIEDIPGPSFFTDCVNKKIVVKNAEGETTEIPWANISLDQVSRLDLIVIPSSRTACKIYLSIHPSVATAHGGHYNFNRRYLTPQTYYIGEVPVGLTGNDCHYALLDNNSEQMALFRVSVIQGINIADYLAIETI